MKLVDKSRIFDVMNDFHLKNLFETFLLHGIQRYIGKLFPNFISNYVVANVVGKTKQNHFDNNRMPCMLANEPGCTSTRNMLHWMQMIRSGYMSHYDYGKTKNMIHYG